MNLSVRNKLNISHPNLHAHRSLPLHLHPPLDGLVATRLLIGVRDCIDVSLAEVVVWGRQANADVTVVGEVGDCALVEAVGEA